MINLNKFGKDNGSAAPKTELGHSVSLNLGVQRERAQLRINNLHQFLESYQPGIEFYKGAFEVIADLEAKIAFENDPDKYISITYKANNNGDIVFKYMHSKWIENILHHYYEFEEFIS